MGKARLLLDGPPKNAASFSLAYSQARPWAPIRSAAVHGLFVLLVVWLCVAAVSLLTPSTAPMTQLAAHSAQYVLVVDSGSSGTRINAYRWILPMTSKPGALPSVQGIPPTAAAHLIPKKKKAGLYNRVETQPGLDAFLGNPDGLSAHALGPLLAWASAVIPAAQHSSTPLFLLGTGGLRRMEQQAAYELMRDIRQYLKQSGFWFEDSWARIVSGSQEGIYGWLALNYQQGRLQQHQAQPVSTAPALPPSSSTAGRVGGHVQSELSLGLPGNTLVSLGTLDMGGSSLEMTFEVDLDSQQLVAGSSEYQNVTLAGKTFFLHTYTFKKYGLNEAYDRAVTLFLNDSHGFIRQQQQQQPQQNVQTAHQQVRVVGNVDASVAAPATSVISDSTGNFVYYGNVIRSSSMASNVFDHQLQADLAAAAAAGLQAQPADFSPASASTRPPSINTMEMDLQVEQHRQADLAVAAAAGLHPTPSATAPAAHQMQVDAAVAAVVGQLPAVQQQELAQFPAGDLANPSSQQAVMLSGSVVITPGTHQASQHSTVAGSTIRRTAASEQAVAATTVQLQAPSSHSTSGDAGGHVTTNPHAQSGLQPGTTSVLLAATTEAGRSAAVTRDGLPLRRDLLQHSRQQRRRQRQLLLQQHAEPLQGMGVGFNSLARELQELVSPQDLWHVTHQHDHQNPGKQDVTRNVQWHQSHPAIEQASDDKMGNTKLLAPGVPAAGPSASATLRSHGEGQQASTASAAPGSVMPAAHGDTLAGSTSSDPGAGNPTHQQQSSTLLITAASTTAHSATRVMPQLPILLHPCLHEGYEEPYDRIAYNGKQPQPSRVMLRGSPSWHSCLRLVGAVVNATAPCTTTPQRPVCRLGSAQPQVQGMFLALTGFHIVAKFLGVPSNVSLDSVLDASQQLCSRPWSWVHQHLGEQMNTERYCMWGPYIVKLLREGLLLKDSAVHVGSGDLGWPLGAALFEASKLPEMMDRQRRPSVGAGIKPWIVTQQQLGLKGEGQHVGSTEQPVASYSQHSSLAQRLWGNHKRLHIGQVSIVFICVVAWVSVVMCCLPTNHSSATASFPSPWPIPGHPKLSSRASMSPVLPVAGHYRGRNSPNTSRNSVKH